MGGFTIAATVLAFALIALVLVFTALKEERSPETRPGVSHFNLVIPKRAPFVEERHQISGGERRGRPHRHSGERRGRPHRHKGGAASNMEAIEDMRQQKEALKQQLDELRPALATLEEAGFKGAGVQLLEARLQEVEREFNRLADEILVRSLLLAGETALGPIVTAAIAEEGAKEFFSDTNITFRVTFDGSGGEPTIKGELEGVILQQSAVRLVSKGATIRPRPAGGGHGSGTVA